MFLKLFQSFNDFAFFVLNLSHNFEEKFSLHGARTWEVRFCCLRKHLENIHQEATTPHLEIILAISKGSDKSPSQAKWGTKI